MHMSGQDRNELHSFLSFEIMSDNSIREDFLFVAQLQSHDMQCIHPPQWRFTGLSACYLTLLVRAAVS